MKSIYLLFLSCSSIFARESVSEYMQAKYQDVYGYGIPTSETQMIESAGSSPTYGEITYEGLSKLLSDLKLSKKDIFYDLGSGNGKVIIQTAYETPVKKAVGIELSPTRFKQANEVKTKLPKDMANRVVFKEEDIVNSNISDATVIFMCSTCFPDSLMNTLAKKFLKLRPGTTILSLKRLPTNDLILLEKEYHLPMTWSENTSVYRYRVKN